jgi:RNA polymerase sigma-70 factor (ECF subfamily)
MTSPEACSRVAALGESDPLPPDDCCAEEGWRSDVEALYRTNADRLVRHFASATSDRETARDLVHEAFARLAALPFARRMIVSRPDAYLYRMCLNLLRDGHRSQRTQTRVAEPSLTQVRQNPHLELENRDTLRRLEAAMLRLNPRTREIFLAKRLDGMTYAEIAERTGLSVKGVEKHMCKAIAAISRVMERDRS